MVPIDNGDAVTDSEGESIEASKLRKVMKKKLNMQLKEKPL